MKLLSILLFGILLSSCGVISKDFKHKEEERQFETSDPVFSSYVESFEQQARIQTGNQNFNVGDVPVNFGDTEEENFEGVCFIYPNDKKEILIKKSWWDSAHHLAKESLLFHELGHCRLSREHENGIFNVNDKNVKQSMMNSVIVNPNEYVLYKSEYIAELFTNSKLGLMQALGL